MKKRQNWELFFPAQTGTHSAHLFISFSELQDYLLHYYIYNNTQIGMATDPRVQTLVNYLAESTSPNTTLRRQGMLYT